MHMMNTVGIRTTARVARGLQLAVSHAQRKVRRRSARFTPSNIPGIMLRNRLSTMAADSRGGQNWVKIRNPAVDAMIDLVMAARTPEDFYAATRALDRILLWSFYYIPALGAPGYRLVYWDRFGRPEDAPPLLRSAWLDTWWWDEAKAARVEAGLSTLLSED